DPVGRLRPADDIDGDHRPEAGVADPLDRRVLLQPSREVGGVAPGALHAEGERAHPPKSEPDLRRTRNGAPKQSVVAQALGERSPAPVLAGDAGTEDDV